MTLFNYPYDNTQVTVELREIVESGVNIWDFDYPTFYTGDEKTAFEKKVIDHYYFRQIGQETVGRWLHYFRSRMREIMPYYIQLYNTVKIMDELPSPFDNVDIVETFSEERTGTSTGTSSTTGETETTGTSHTENTGTSSGTDETTASHTEEHTRKFSNTPQGSINNLDSYLTEANVETADDGDTQTATSSANTSATSDGTASGTETRTGSETSSGTQTERVEHTYTKKGNQGVNTYAHDMLEYRQTLINIDMQIINELKDLFLMVY